MNIMLTIDPITNPVITGIAGKSPDETPGLFGKFFSSLVMVILVGATIWTFIQLLWGGLDWISSGGDKSRLEMAQHRITTAILGLILIFGSWAFYLLILQFLGLSPLGGTGGIELKLPTLF